MKLKEIIEFGEMALLKIGLLLIILIIVINLATYVVCGMSFFEQIYVYKNAKENIYELVKEPWFVEEISLLTIMKTRGNNYEVYVEVYRSTDYEWTNDLVLVDKQGNILKEDLTGNMH